MNTTVSTVELTELGNRIFPHSPIGAVLINNSCFGLSRIAPLLSVPGMTILEVGAGSCLLSAYLARKGFAVTAVEPMGDEFDFLADYLNPVIAFSRDNRIALNVIRSGGEEITLSNHFDLAFTINALEHMADPFAILDRMYESLKPGGTLFAHCPNYTVPFDSHFNIVLVTRSKTFNGWLYRKRISAYPSVWKELNFIRYANVRRHIMTRGWEHTFNRSTIRDALVRLRNDPAFAGRIPTWLKIATAAADRSGILGLVPARFQTPMEVSIRKVEITARASRYG